MSKVKNTIVISDTHFPYAHRDTLPFLKAIKDKYDIKIAKHVGDVCDNHTSSFHDIEYGTLSAKDEYHNARIDCQALAELFPKMTISLGNHDRITERKARSAGMGEHVIRTYNEIYGVDWDWVDHDYFKIDEFNHCMMTHSMSRNTLTNAKTHSHCSMQGHHHGTSGIEYFADKQVLRWSMTVGCLIDPDHPAFNYGKNNSNNRPILTCGGIIDDSPQIFKMQLRKSGRWNQKL